jgi:hypothetical protein
MIKDADRFSKLLGGIQAAVVSIAVLVGGVWSLYIFNAQLQVQNAVAQLTKLKREIDAEPKLEIGLQLMQLHASGTKKLIEGVLNIRNTGTADLAVVLRDTPLELFTVDFDEIGNERWTLIKAAPLRQSEKTVYGTLAIQAGTQVARGFLISVERSGLYALKFSAARSKEDIKRLVGGGAPTADIANRTEWGGHNYISVE